MGFPAVRLRRSRRTPLLRRMVRETRLSAADLVLPLFVCPGEGVEQPIGSMPGVARQSVDRIVETAAAAYEEGVPAVILFGIPERKDAVGSASWDDDGIVQRALRALREHVPGAGPHRRRLLLRVHRPRPLRRARAARRVDNDATLENLARQAVSLAARRRRRGRALGHDGRPGRRHPRARSTTAGFADTLILAYAAKFASGFYGPFREAAGSTPSFGDRRSYQMDPANGREALREVALDVEEGADMLMVKPALAYLDVIAAMRAALRACRSPPTT